MCSDSLRFCKLTLQDILHYFAIAGEEQLLGFGRGGCSKPSLTARSLDLWAGGWKHCCTTNLIECDRDFVSCLYYVFEYFWDLWHHCNTPRRADVVTLLAMLFLPNRWRILWHNAVEVGWGGFRSCGSTYRTGGGYQQRELFYSKLWNFQQEQRDALLIPKEIRKVSKRLGLGQILISKNGAMAAYKSCKAQLQSAK